MAATGNDTESWKSDAGPVDGMAINRGRSQPATSHPAKAATTDSGYVHWVYLGAESMFFYPPGSVKEHLVVDHGIPSGTMHWQVRGKLYDHAGDHRRQQNVALDDLGDLLAVTHSHGPTASYE